MPAWEDVCAIFEQLPGTELDRGVDNPAWRVDSKVLARLNPRMRIPDEDEIRREQGALIAVRVLDAGELQLLLASDPDTFFITPHWVGAKSALIWLERIDIKVLEGLLIDAWRSKAQKRVVRTWEDARRG